jgi:N-methylhydantoinase B/oxoprolinase/acetone carboxylase alpha subunit
VNPPYGSLGGNPGSPGHNNLIRNGEEMVLPGKIALNIEKEDILQISTPGGGGWGNLSS